MEEQQAGREGDVLAQTWADGSLEGRTGGAWKVWNGGMGLEFRQKETTLGFGSLRL